MPYEDFTAYVEVDPNSHIGLVGTNHVDFKAYNNEDAYLYSDKGPDHFGTGWEHKIDVKYVSHSSYNTNAVWMLSNDIDDITGLSTAGKSAVYVNTRYSAAELMEICEMYLGSIYSSSSFTMTAGTMYYLTVKRDGTAFTCKIYSDSARTNLLATLSLTLNDAQPNHRYVFAANTNNNGQNRWGDFDIENLDLQEVGVTEKGFSDVGEGSDAFINPYRAMGISDVGHGAEAFTTPFRAMGFADVGYGTDAFIVLLQKAFADSGLGLDAFAKEVIGFIEKVFSDGGYGADSFSKIITFLNKTFGDFGYGTDIFIIPCRAMGFSDSGHGVDAFLIVFKTVFFSDAGYGSDSFGSYIPGAVAKTKLFLIIGDLAIQLTKD